MKKIFEYAYRVLNALVFVLIIIIRIPIVIVHSICNKKNDDGGDF